VPTEESIESNARREPFADAIVVLGCAVRLDQDGRLAPGALRRRIDAAANAYRLRANDRTVVVASGGRRWRGSVEADVMARELILRGVPDRVVIRERCSLTTLDNARFSAGILERRGVTGAAIVTCAWHLPRAVDSFARAGLTTEPLGACDPNAPTWMDRIGRAAREGFLSWVQDVEARIARARCGARPAGAGKG
jgi:uncharacterized SAM-binding protein YcdF (DUF218 family)